MSAEQKKPFTAYNLVNAMEEFISDNTHSRDTKTRWFAGYLREYVAPLARRIRSDNLDDGDRKLVAAFRLSEIEAEKADKQREIDTLESEARKLSAA